MPFDCLSVNTGILHFDCGSLIGGVRNSQLNIHTGSSTMQTCPFQDLIWDVPNTELEFVNAHVEICSHSAESRIMGG